jgi:hypothetical protein
MVKYSCNNGDIELELDGDIAELCADIDMLILEVYGKLLETDKDEADVFKRCIKRSVKNEVCFKQNFTPMIEEALISALLFPSIFAQKEPMSYEEFSKKFSMFMDDNKDDED